jgi:hypothetical protein
MSLTAERDYEIFQSLEDFQSYSPILSSTQLLIEEAKSKLSIEKISKFSNSGINQDENTSQSNSYTITTNIPEKDAPATPIYYFETKIKSGRAISLQKWLGVVTGIRKKSFSADLINLTHQGYDEETEISIEEITDEDRGLIKLGSFFYWSIGYHHSYSGQRTRMSQIRFKRMPGWDKTVLKGAEIKAEKTAKVFGWDVK